MILDRYLDSSVVYQGVGRGLGLDEVLELNLLAVGGLLPDRTFVLVLDAAASRGRASAAGPTGSSVRTRASTRAWRRGYERLAALHPERIVVLDGSARRPTRSPCWCTRS